MALIRDRQYPVTECVGAGMAWAISSIGNLIINKLVIKDFRYAFTMIFAQNAMTCLIIMMMTGMSEKIRLHPINGEGIKGFFVQVMLFCGILISSLQSLRYVSIPTVIVFRNITPLLVVLLSGAWLLEAPNEPRRITVGKVIALVVVVVGSVIYGYYDIDFHHLGYLWCISNSVLMCLYSIFVKWFSIRTQYNTMTFTFYSNMLSLPILIVGALITQELPFAAPLQLHDLPFASKALLLLSCVCGFALSSSGMWAQLVYSATAWVAYGNFTKIPLVLTSALVFQDKLSAQSIVGLVISLLGFSIYTYLASIQRSAAKNDHEYFDVEAVTTRRPTEDEIAAYLTDKSSSSDKAASSDPEESNPLIST